MNYYSRYNQYESKIYPGKIPNSVFFLDQLPAAPHTEESKIITTEVKKWRFQQILANHPWGIPSLTFIQEYKKYFVRDLDLDMRDMGYHDFHDMITSLNEIFTIQEPDEVTALIFPNYPEDYILHDARYKHIFHVPEQNACDSLNQSKTDFEAIIALANLNRDEPFPNDVVLAGKEYYDFMLPQNLANIEGTRGVYKVLLISGANPGHFFVNFYDEIDKVSAMTNDLGNYYYKLASPKDTHIVPDEFIYNGFPCVVYMTENRIWERCSIITRSKKNNKVLVDLVDFGGVVTVNRMNLYLMPSRYLDMPKQAVCMSLAGVLPKKERFSSNSATRLICFSNPGYKLHCLLLDPIKSDKQIFEDSVSPSGYNDKNDNGDSKRKRLSKQRVQFEAILCDRNDEDMDLFLDQILILETYCKKDESRLKELEDLRAKFKLALEKIPKEITSI